MSFLYSNADFNIYTFHSFYYGEGNSSSPNKKSLSGKNNISKRPQRFSNCSSKSFFKIKSIKVAF